MGNKALNVLIATKPETLYPMRAARFGLQGHACLLDQNIRAQCVLAAPLSPGRSYFAAMRQRVCSRTHAPIKVQGVTVDTRIMQKQRLHACTRTHMNPCAHLLANTPPHGRPNARP